MPLSGKLKLPRLRSRYFGPLPIRRNSSAGGETTFARLRFGKWTPAAGKWRFEASDPSGKIVVNGVSASTAYGEITEFDPPRLLAYTWLGNWHDHPERPSAARWELSATKTGTRVKVTHSGLADQPVARQDYAGGWPGLLELLRKYCE